MARITTAHAESVELGDLRHSRLRELEVTAVVSANKQVAERVAEIHLCRSDGDDWPEWTPGAHIDVLLPNGLVRQYSLCGRETDRSILRIGVLREVNGRGGSAWLHDDLSVGDAIVVRGPRNVFQLRTHSSYIFIAGGIGITPILSMVRHVSEMGLPWELHYGGRGASSMAFVEELEALSGGILTMYLGDEGGRMPLDSILGYPLPETGIYACGPETLLSGVDDFRARWPKDAIHVERFEPPAEALDSSENQPIAVSLALSGIDFDVAVDETILEAAEKRGIAVLSSCRVGTCGTCETPVIEGEPDHRDSVLDEDERARNDCMMICVSRATSDRLVLDL